MATAHRREDLDPSYEETGTGSSGALSYSKIVDLSWPITSDIPRWPGDPRVEFESVADLGRQGYNLRRFSMGEHSGTHLTTPSCYYPGGAGPQDYGPSRLLVQAAVLDVRRQCQEDHDYRLSLEDLRAWESHNGAVETGSLVLLGTGWSHLWSHPAAYLGSGADGDMHFPGFGLEATRFLLAERNVGGIGTDTAGVEPGLDQSFAVSKLVLAEPRIVLENLANLDQLPPTGAVLVIGLLRLAGGSGAPAAVTAFIP